MIKLICFSALAWDLATNTTASSRQNSGNLYWSIIKSYPPLGRPGTEHEHLFQCLIWGLQRDGEAQLSLSLMPSIETRFSWLPKQSTILHRTRLHNWEMHTWTEPLDHWGFGVEFLFIYLMIAGLHRAVQRFQRRNTKPEKNLLFYWLPVSWMSEFPQKLLKICLILSVEGGEELKVPKMGHVASLKDFQVPLPILSSIGFNLFSCMEEPYSILKSPYYLEHQNISFSSDIQNPSGHSPELCVLGNHG